MFCNHTIVIFMLFLVIDNYLKIFAFVTVSSYRSFVNYGSCLSLSCTTIGNIAEFAVSEKKWKSSVESTIRSMINSNKIEEVISILSTLNSSYLPNGRNVVYIITETCRKSENLQIMLPLLKSLKLSKIVCKEDDIMPSLSQCADRGDMRPIQSVVSWLESHNIQFSARTYATLLKGYGIQKNEQMIDFILKFIQQKPIKTDVILLNSALSAYIRCGNIQKAISLFDSVLVGSLSKLTSTYSTSTSPSPISPQQFLNDHIIPNTRSYNIILHGLALGSTSESLNKCMNIIDVMNRSKIPMDTFTMNILTNACVKSGNMEAAEQLLLVPIAPADAQAYTSVLSGYANKGQVEDAFRILNLMIKNNLSPNSYTLTALMTACMNGKAWPLARSLLSNINNYFINDLTEQQLSILYGTYISGLSKVEGGIFTVMNEIEKMNKRNMTVDIAVMNSLLQGLCNNNPPLLDKAIYYLNTMLISGPFPDSVTYSILFTAFSKDGNYEDAIALYEYTDIKLDSTAINSFLKCLISSPESSIQAISLYNTLFLHNYTQGVVEEFIPTKITYTIIFLGLVRILSPSSSSMLRINKNNSNNKLITNETLSIKNNFKKHKILTSKLPENFSMDKLLYKLYYDMRFEYGLEVDEVMLAAFNGLFSILYNQLYNLKLDFVGLNANRVFSVKTARLIFEDLFILGWAPKQMIPILSSCGFSDRKVQKYLELEGLGENTQKTAASYRIFKRHGWNKVESGWSPF